MLNVSLRRLAPALATVLGLSVAAWGQHGAHTHQQHKPQQHGQPGCESCIAHERILHAIHEHLMAAHGMDPHKAHGQHGSHDKPHADPAMEVHHRVLHLYTELGKALHDAHNQHQQSAHGQHGHSDHAELLRRHQAELKKAHEAELKRAKKAKKAKKPRQKARQRHRIKIVV